MRFKLYPPPERSSIPPNVVVYSGGTFGDSWYLCLRRNGTELVIEAPEPNWRKNVLADKSDSSYHGDSVYAMTQAYAELLETIQSLLPYIRFGVTNWAYLLKDRKGQHFIRHRERALHSISCPVWATLIPEEEIEYTIFGSWCDRRGVWRHKKVDVYYAGADVNFRTLDKIMHGYKAVQGLDLTYEVYGHLVGKNGAIIGIVTEAANGRMICASDKALVYMAISKLQKAGFLYRNCGENQFMIQDNQVRLLELSAVKRYTDREQLNKDAESLHWQELADLFEEIETQGEFEARRCPPFRLVRSPTDLECLLPKVSPEHPLKIEVNLYVSSSWFPYFSVLWGQQACNTMPRRQVQPPDTQDSPDKPLLPSALKGVGVTLPRTQKNRAVILPYHPYRRSSTAHNNTILLRTASSQMMNTDGTFANLSTGMLDPASNTVATDEEVPNILSPALTEALHRCARRGGD